MRERLAVVLMVMIAAALPPAPALAQEPQQTKLVLGETATREVEQDTLAAVLSARAQAASPREAQQSVNTAMTAAIEKARGVEGVRPSTGNYRVYQEHDREGPTGEWIAEQDLRLKSQRIVPLLELVGVLQGDGMIVGNLAYELSPEARRELQDELTVEAIEALRGRAEQVAASMGKRVDMIQTVRVGSVGEPPVRPMMRSAMAAEAADASPPVALPDLETVSVSVEAEVALARQ